MKRIRVRCCIAYGLLLWLFGVLMVGAKFLSLTLDEPIHVAAGYALLARGRDALWILPPHGHPPLLNLLEAALIYSGNPHIPLENLNGWGTELTKFMRAFYPYLRPLERTELVARTPIIWLSLLLGALVFRWASELWGQRAGLIALGILCFDPLLRAHGRLATTDAGTVTLGTASLYAVWRWMKDPSWSKAFTAGGLLGLTMLAKGSGVFWTAAAALLVLWTIVKTPKKQGIRLAQGAAAGLVSLLILWGGYGFTWGPIGNLPGSYPAPAHWIGLLSQARSAEERWVFALGLRKHGHWWWYFPLAFMLKNPIPFLIAAIAGGIALLRQARPVSPVLTILVFPALYTAISVARGMNIGYRHMLPIHPAMYLLASYAVSHGVRSSHPLIRQITIITLGVWYVLGTISVFPYEIAYFNELIGGPKNGHYYLVDANLDWGQGYKALRRYLEEHPGPTPKLAPRFTYIQPEDYGIAAVPLPPADEASPLQAPFHPAPGRYIISITTLQQGWPTDNEIYAWFRQAQPSAMVGYSFFFYDVKSSPLEWFAQCDTPGAPLDTRLIAWGFGQNDLRLVYFDCRSAWIYPAGRIGAYGLHHELVPEKRSLFSLLPSPPQADDPFIARRLADLRLSLNMRRYTDQHPAFALYEQEQPPRLPSSQPVAALFAGQWPAPPSSYHTTPLALDGPLTFLGALTHISEEQLDVETWWQVTEGPITRPLSIMGHLLNSEGELLGQNDGLGVPPVVWQPGDIIVQRHRFPRPPDGAELWFRTGVYWLDTMERWMVADADLLLLKIINYGQ